MSASLSWPLQQDDAKSVEVSSEVRVRCLDRTHTSKCIIDNRVVNLGDGEGHVDPPDCSATRFVARLDDVVDDVQPLREVGERALHCVNSEPLHIGKIGFEGL